MITIKSLLFLASFVLIALAFAVAPTAASAASNGSLRHAHQPYVVAGTGAMRARVDNFATMPQSRLVCVEAFRTDNGAKTHLGCLTLNLASYRSADQWAVEFDAPTYWLKHGNYRVVYTYQAADGSWHRIKSIFLSMQDGRYP